MYPVERFYIAEKIYRSGKKGLKKKKEKKKLEDCGETRNSCLTGARFPHKYSDFRGGSLFITSLDLPDKENCWR